MSSLSSPSSLSTSRSKFTHVKPDEKLGQQHESLAAFRQATANFTATMDKKYTLVMVCEPARRRILLGLKRRGFGNGMYNSFGGKIEEGETEAESARRELLEETGIDVPLHVVSDAKVGVLDFTFDDSPVAMIVHLFRINVVVEDAISTTTTTAAAVNGKENPNKYYPGKKHIPLDPTDIRGCDEITPQWFDDWQEIPLQNMFADDSVWLTHLLHHSEQDLLLDGHFHFRPGGQDTNQIMHYYVNARHPTKVGGEVFSLEKRLFHELHNNCVRSPNIKEFKESYAFVNAVRKMFDQKKHCFDLVVDVAGGHGALAGIFLAVNTAPEAVVVDPADVGRGSVQKAWAKYLEGKELRYRHEGLQTGLPAELAGATKRGIPPDRILVVACHACQHLSDETLQIACGHGSHVAVMPCCQRDLSPGSVWKTVAKSLGIPMEIVMDILLAGKAMSWFSKTSYDVRMKVLERSSTPQNRLILCRVDASMGARRQESMAAAETKLDKAYHRAHILAGGRKASFVESTLLAKSFPLVASFCLGVALAAFALRR